MIKIFVTNKKTKEVRELSCKDVVLLKKVIADIKSRHFDMNLYEIEGTDEVEKFLKETYNPKFFSFNPVFGRFYLRKLENGVKRTLPKPRKINNEKNFHKTLEKIYKDIARDVLLDSNYGCAIQLRQNTALDVWIVIEVTEKDKQIALASIQFDKLKWEFEFISLTSMEHFEHFYKEFKRVFEYRTSSTRKYRAKKHLKKQRKRAKFL